MSIDPRLLHDVELAESPNGVPELTAYRDSLGNWTIGFGHLMHDQEHAAGVTITRAQADQFLQDDLADAALQAAATPEWLCLDTTCRQNAVIELIFNMGEHRWLGFIQCRAALRRQDWMEARQQLLSSRWSTQVHQRRANRLADYLLTGTYPSP